MSQKIAILGIHTDIGKTVVSAIATEALHADYWKPVQAGDLANSDSIKVSRLISNKRSIIHPEAIKLLMAASPHTAAAHEHKQYDCQKFRFPDTENILLIETAGGVFSPVDDKNTVIDFVQHFNLPVILVSRNYLGSINHTLLCIEALKQRNIKVLTLVISGTSNKSTEDFIKEYSGIEHVIYVNELAEITKENILKESAHFLQQWNEME